MKTNIAIDSMKLRIPFNFCRVIDPTLMDRFVLINERELNENGSIEVDEFFFKEKSLWKLKNGAKTRFAVQKMTDHNQEIKEYLIILVNSKLLGKDYFNGINLNTINRLYREIMSLNVVQFDFDHLMQYGYLSDTDFKRDWIQKNHDQLYGAIIKDLDKNKKSALSLKGYRYFNKKENKGLEFGDRRRATADVPFFKIYSKAIELRRVIKQVDGSYSLPDFYVSNQTHFDSMEGFNDVIRAEFTLKNRKAFKNFLNCDNSLSEVLSLNQKDLIKALQKIKQIHITDRIKPKAVKGYSPTDRMILNLLDWIQDIEEVDWHKVERYVLSGYDLNNPSEQVARSRAKKKLEKIFYDSIYTHEDSLHYKEQQEYILNGMRMIGYVI